MSVGVERLSRRFRNEVRVKNILNERVKQNGNVMMNVRRGWETTKEVQEWGKNEEYSEWEWGTKCECYECWKWLTDYYTQRRSENEVRGLNSELVKSVWEVEAKYNCGSKYWLGLTDSTIHEIYKWLFKYESEKQRLWRAYDNEQQYMKVILRK